VGVSWGLKSAMWRRGVKEQAEGISAFDANDPAPIGANALALI